MGAQCCRGKGRSDGKGCERFNSTACSGVTGSGANPSLGLEGTFGRFLPEVQASGGEKFAQVGDKFLDDFEPIFSQSQNCRRIGSVAHAQASNSSSPQNLSSQKKRVRMRCT